MKYYTLYDWDGTVIFEKATLERITDYFGLENINDKSELETMLNEMYDGMKTPYIEEY